MTEATEEIIEKTEELTLNVEDNDDNIQKPKAKRTEKQIKALELARQNRSEKAKKARDEKEILEAQKKKDDEKAILRKEILHEMKLKEKEKQKEIEIPKEELPKEIPKEEPRNKFRIFTSSNRKSGIFKR